MRALEEWFRRVVEDDAPGLIPSLARLILRIFSWPYSAFIEIYKLLFQLGVLKTVRLPCRVVCVGNITMGGVGKTVAVQSAARALQAAGKQCAIICYGYGAAAGGTVGIVSDADEVYLGPGDAGDEPVLLAESLPGVPVLVARRRAEGAREALRRFAPDVILMDDGFQHWRLFRDVDLVLLDARRPLGNGRVFPAGTLRERPAALRRATECVLTRCSLASALELSHAQDLVRSLREREPLQTDHHLGGWREIIGAPHRTGAEPLRLIDPAGLPGPVWVVAGIGQNDSFLQAVYRSGAVVAGFSFFEDHHPYSPGDVQSIQEQARACSAVVTTEKDAVKLRALWTGPISLAAVQVELSGITPDEWVRICFAAD